VPAAPIYATELLEAMPEGNPMALAS